MDDFMSKMQEMLSDEETLNQIKELADMFMSSNDEEGVQNNPDSSSVNSDKSDSEDNSSGNSGDFDFDIGMLMKLASLFGSTPKNDKNTQFLLALKPLLKDEKHQKVDKAVKMLRLYAVWTVVKESGMLKDFL